MIRIFSTIHELYRDATWPLTSVLLFHDYWFLIPNDTQYDLCNGETFLQFFNNLRNIWTLTLKTTVNISYLETLNLVVMTSNPDFQACFGFSNPGFQARFSFSNPGFQARFSFSNPGFQACLSFLYFKNKIVLVKLPFLKIIQNNIFIRIGHI